MAPCQLQLGETCPDQTVMTVPSSASAPAVNILQTLLRQQMSSGNCKTDHHTSNRHSARDVLKFCEYYIAVTGLSTPKRSDEP